MRSGGIPDELLFDGFNKRSVSMTNPKWIGLLAVTLIAVAIVAYRTSVSSESDTVSDDVPRVLLVADLSEADKEGDRCAEIIQAVRRARDRGIVVQEHNPDSKSPLLSRYRVLTDPTVLILSQNGDVVSRHEGEAAQTVAAIRTQLEQLR